LTCVWPFNWLTKYILSVAFNPFTSRKKKHPHPAISLIFASTITINLDPALLRLILSYVDNVLQLMTFTEKLQVVVYNISIKSLDSGPSQGIGPAQNFIFIMGVYIEIIVFWGYISQNSQRGPNYLLDFSPVFLHHFYLTVQHHFIFTAHHLHFYTPQHWPKR